MPAIFEFTLVCEPATALSDNDTLVDSLYEAGCDDALVVERAGVFVLAFDREASNLETAIASARADVARAGMVTRRVGPDPLVNASDIANRAGVTRQAVSNYVAGKRGKSFPRPVARVETDSPLWSWLEVVQWFRQTRNGKLSDDDIFQAHVIEQENRLISGG